MKLVQDWKYKVVKARLFAERFQIPITWFSGEGHSLSNDISTPNRVVDMAVSFFGAVKQ